MKISYLVNYLDPQMAPFCDELYRLTDHSFRLIQTEAFPDRLIQNHHEDLANRPYIIDIHTAADRKSAAEKELQGSDILLSGHSEEQFFDLCVRSGIPTFRLSQLIYRHFDIYHVPLKWKISYYLKHTIRLRNKPVYMLCMGTYTSQDYALTHSYDGKRYVFAEFPPAEKIKIDEVMKQKPSDPPIVLWSGKMEPYRDPMICISAAEILQKKKIPFRMVIAGEGSLLSEFQKQVSVHKLDSMIQFIPDCSEMTVSHLMEQASVYLETGHLHEGWGEEVNHAMNYGDAAVVSHLCGASMMIQNGVNGILFEQGNAENLAEKIAFLLTHKEKMQKIGRKAFHFITEEFTGEIAADRFLKLAEAVRNGKEDPFSEGLCSHAPVITYESMKKIADQEESDEQ